LSVVTVNTSATGGVPSAEQTVYILYITLAGADLILVLFSIILLFGVEPVICARIDYFDQSRALTVKLTLKISKQNSENNIC